MDERIKILDLLVDPVNEKQALERVGHFLEKGDRPYSIFAVNPEKNFLIPKDPVLHEMFNTADLLIPDGIGIVLAARVIHGMRLSRVPGVELMEKICKLAAVLGNKVFIYGASEEVNKAAVKNLKNRYPKLKIVGRCNGYMKEEEMQRLIDRINSSRADILFVGLGSPKQEKWIATYRDALKNIKVCQGIGGTLDIIAGNKKRSPEIWRNWGTEWAYRLISEPQRIGRQKALPLFAWMVLSSKLKKGRGSSRGE